MSRPPTLEPDLENARRKVGPACALLDEDGNLVKVTEGLAALLGGAAPATGSPVEHLLPGRDPIAPALLRSLINLLPTVGPRIVAESIRLQLPGVPGSWSPRLESFPGQKGRTVIALGFQPAAGGATNLPFPLVPGPSPGPDHERLMAVLRGISQGVILTDGERRVIYLSREAERLSGWRHDQATGRLLSEIFQLMDSNQRSVAESPVESIFISGLPLGSTREMHLVTRDGRAQPISFSAYPVKSSPGEVLGVVVLLHDPSERMRTEKELRRLQEIESVSLLAGGIAHDFNNVLTGILGNLSLARSCIDVQDPAHAIVKAAERATVRAKDLTRQMQGLVHGAEPRRQPLVLDDLLRETAQFILRGSPCRLSLRLATGLWPALVDEGQISQVLQNLLLNGVQATPQGGTIELIADNVELTGDHLEPLASGRYVRLRIRDEGCGIPPDHLPRIFDPYFSTKPRGTGLGLATTYSIMCAHDGYVGVESQPGVGTCFTLYFPATDAPPHGAAAIGESTEPPEGPLARGSGRILVMDDEPMIQQITGEMLRHLGYQVEFARDGLEAVEKYRLAQGSASAYELVLLDLTIPGGHGARETLDALRSLDPEVIAVITSGYGNDPLVLHPLENGFAASIIKPFNLHQLGEALAGARRT